jgi:hypothetical protein
VRFDLQGTISAMGGAGGTGSNSNAGGDGGVGRMRVDASIFTEATPVSTPNIGYRGLLFPLERYRIQV